jgi:hypothetical protein
MDDPEARLCDPIPEMPTDPAPVTAPATTPVPETRTKVALPQAEDNDDNAPHDAHVDRNADSINQGDYVSPDKEPMDITARTCTAYANSRAHNLLTPPRGGLPRTPNQPSKEPRRIHTSVQSPYRPSVTLSQDCQRQMTVPETLSHSGHRTRFDNNDIPTHHGVGRTSAGGGYHLPTSWQQGDAGLHPWR